MPWSLAKSIITRGSKNAEVLNWVAVKKLELSYHDGYIYIE